MSIAVAAAVFGLVAVAELPDKTMIANIVMGGRGRPLPVWLGASAAFAPHAALAVAAGRFLQLLPHRTLQIVIAAVFGVGALYLLLVPERSEEARGEAGALRRRPGEGSWRVALTAFVVIVVGEFGDLTQILIANLEARYKSPVSVFVGGYLALVLVAAVAAFSGRALLRVLPLQTIRRLGGVVLVGLCAYSISTIA